MLSIFPSVYMGPGAAPAERTRDSAFAPSQPRGVAQPKRAVIVGTTDPYVSSLFKDVLRDVNIDVLLDDELGPRPEPLPDAVLAMVERTEGVQVITEAKSRFAGVPIVAILPLGVHRLGTKAVSAGAQACYLLDMPIDRLRGILAALLRDAPAASKPKRKPRARRG